MAEVVDLYFVEVRVVVKVLGTVTGDVDVREIVSVYSVAYDVWLDVIEVVSINEVDVDTVKFVDVCETVETKVVLVDVVVDVVKSTSTIELVDVPIVDVDK